MHSTVGTVLAYLQLAIGLVYWQVQLAVSQEFNVELRKSANNSDNLQVQLASILVFLMCVILCNN